MSKGFEQGFYFQFLWFQKFPNFQDFFSNLHPKIFFLNPIYYFYFFCHNIKHLDQKKCWIRDGQQEVGRYLTDFVGNNWLHFLLLDKSCGTQPRWKSSCHMVFRSYSPFLIISYSHTELVVQHGCQFCRPHPSASIVDFIMYISSQICIWFTIYHIRPNK